MADPTLKRGVGLPMLVLYGVGTIVGGGFYALIGKVAGAAGTCAPLAVALAGGLALLSACSFAELSARHPESAGEARYVQAAFGRGWLASVTGVLVATTGIVSAATLTNAIVGFLQDRMALDGTLGCFAVVGVMGLVAAWGIGQSVLLVVVITFVEVGGLLFVLGAAGGSLAELPDRWTELLPGGGLPDLEGIALGAFILFYAFIGFEDMVNLAEEVKRPRRNLPRAILLSLAITMLLYLSVTLVAVMALPAGELARSRTPLAALVASHGAGAVLLLSVISILAGFNGALVQIVMASRVGYGLARRGLAPAWLGRVNAVTRTPLHSTAVVSAVVLALALWFPLVTLAKATSFIILLVFAVVNLALFRLKVRGSPPPAEGPDFPRLLPLAGFVACLAFVAFELAS